MVQLDVNEFLTELAALYKATQESGSVFVTMKPHTTRRTPSEDVASFCLVRASTNTRKISTLVSAREQRTFQQHYHTIHEAHMTSLKKRRDLRKGGKGAEGGAAAGAGAGAAAGKKGGRRRGASGSEAAR